MRNHWFEIVLAAVLAAVYLGVSYWQSGSQLTASELDGYLKALERQLPKDLEHRAEFLARLRAWGENDDGQPVLMLNLMRFHKTLQPFPGAPERGTPEEANAHYEKAVTPMLLKRGGYPLVGGDAMRVRGRDHPESNLLVYDPALDNWDRMLVVRYPCRRAFLDLVSDPAYLQVMPYKLAALQVVLVPVSGALVVPDLRWVVGGVGLAVFLLAGWVRAARRRRQQRAVPEGQSGA
jgi:hypothetical protein